MVKGNFSPSVKFLNNGNYDSMTHQRPQMKPRRLIRVKMIQFFCLEQTIINYQCT